MPSGDRQFLLEGLFQACLEFRDAYLLHNFAQEAANNQAPRLFFWNTARLQVEQLLVVETSAGAGVTSTLDVTGLDLKVRDRVGAGTIGEQEVTVLLVAVCSGALLADQHIPDPDGVSAIA